MHPASNHAERLMEIVRQLSRELHPKRKGVSHLTLDDSLEKDFGIDSLGRMELLNRIEGEFEIHLPEQVIATAETCRELLKKIVSAEVREESGGRRRLPVSKVALPALREEMIAPPVQAKTLLEVLDRHTRSHPERPHILFYGEEERKDEISFADLMRGALRVAGGLKQLNFRPGETAAIMLPTGRDYFYSFFGILYAGGIPVPLYPPVRLSQIEEHLRRHAGILENALVKTLITQRAAKPVAHLLRSRVKGLRDIITLRDLPDPEDTVSAPDLSGDSIALLQYTSGSTGSPKGVVLTHDNLLANIRAMGQVLEVTSRDVFVSWLPLYHDMGLIGAWIGSLYFATPLILMSPLTFLAHPERWFRALHHHGGTISGGPNFAYELCLRKIRDQDIQDLSLHSWRVAFNGAEPVSPETLLAFQKRFAKYGFRPEAFTPVYGLAESSVGLSFPPLHRGPVIEKVRRDHFRRTGRALSAPEDDPDPLRFVACGYPLPGHEIRIVDPAGREVPDREEGHLQFRGPSATNGYFRNPAATASLFHGEWLDSGDLAYLSGGEVYVTGRTKDVIIRAGRNFTPYELEEAIGNLSGIRKGCVAVFGSPDRVTGTERLVILAETRESEETQLEKLRHEIHAVTHDLFGTPPDDVLLVRPHSILKTSSGKIRRAATRTLYEMGSIAGKPRPVWRQMLRLAWTGSLPLFLRYARKLSGLFYAAYAWSLFGMIAVPAWILTAPVPRVQWCRGVARFTTRFAFKLAGIPITIMGEDRCALNTPCVLVANHASYLDGFVLASVLPSRFAFVAKRGLARRFLTRLPLQRIGAEFVERHEFHQGVEDAARIVQSVHEKKSLLFFPEGTFSRAPGLKPFYLGAFLSAVDGGVPVIPIAINGTRSILRAGSWFPRRGAVTVTIGEPIPPVESGWSSAIRLRDKARAFILRHCGEPDV